MFLNNEDMPFELDTAITGGTVVTAGAERRLDVGIRAGRIAALAEPGTLAPAREQIPAAGLIVLPGGIDTHTHIRWPVPGAPDSLDDFRTGTMAAAVGGTTTVIDFVPQPRDRSHWAAASERLAEASGQAVVDFSFHPIVTAADPGTLADIPRLIDAGMGWFKVYTTSEHPLDDGEIRSISLAIAEGGGLAGFHAENHGIIFLDELDKVHPVTGASIPSIWNGVRLPEVTHNSRPFQPAFGSSMRPSKPFAKNPIG